MLYSRHFFYVTVVVYANILKVFYYANYSLVPLYISTLYLFLFLFLRSLRTHDGYSEELAHANPSLSSPSNLQLIFLNHPQDAHLLYVQFIRLHKQISTLDLGP